MIIAIDETGSFGVDSSNRSFFVAVHIRQRKTLYKEKRYQFDQWEKSLPRSLKNSKGEIKSSSLSDDQLTEFARNVVCAHYHIGITPYCIRPSKNPDTIVEKHRKANLIGIRGSAQEMRELRRPESSASLYDDFGNWIERLSYAQYLKIRVLGDCIFTALANTIGHSITEGYDDELIRIKFMIDKDFIKERQHNIFWHEFLRNQLYDHSQKYPLPLLDKWEDKGHPFLEKYGGNGYLNLRELFWKQCSFVSSHDNFEIRIADAVNTIITRCLNRQECHQAYLLVRKYFLKDKKIREMLLHDFNLDNLRYNPAENPWRNLRGKS
jgi:hypothetical protein